MLWQKANTNKNTAINVEVEASENHDDGEEEEAAEGSDSPIGKKRLIVAIILMEKMLKVMVALLKIFLMVKRKLI
jgi:hypothetical protein